MKFEIKITEILERTIKVDARSSGEAFAEVKEKWDNSHIDLGENDFVSVKFEHIK